MENYIQEEQKLVGAIKKQFKDFIRSSDVITKEVKDALIKEIGDNWFDTRFSGRAFVWTACNYAVHEWRNQNLRVAELWREIAVNNSKVNNKPHLVADAVIKRYKEEFKIIEDN